MMRGGPPGYQQVRGRVNKIHRLVVKIKHPFRSPPIYSLVLIHRQEASRQDQDRRARRPCPQVRHH